MQYEDPAFWKNYIESKSAARKIENEERRKRKQEEDEAKAISKKRRLDERSRRADRRERYLCMGSLLTPEATPRKSGLGSSVVKSMGIQEISDDDSGFTRTSRRNSDPFQSFDHEQSGDEDEEAEIARLEQIRQKNLQHVRNNLPQ